MGNVPSKQEKCTASGHRRRIDVKKELLLQETLSVGYILGPLPKRGQAVIFSFAFAV